MLLKLASALVGLGALLLTCNGCDARSSDSGAASGTLPSPAPASPPQLLPATAATVHDAVRAAGGRVVLVNMWATWCEPCREEMPDLLRLRRVYRDKGLAVLLVSGDFPSERPDVVDFLVKHAVDFPSYIKEGQDDMEFVEAISPEWSGALPANFLYDGQGRLMDMWQGKSSYESFEARVLAAFERLAPDESGS